MFLFNLRTLDKTIEKIDYLLENITELQDVPMEGFALLMPSLLRYFHSAKTGTMKNDSVKIVDNEEISACLRLFDVVSEIIGSYQARKYFLDALLSMFEATDSIALQVKLLDFSFARVLIIRLGNNCFIENFLQYYIEALRSVSREIQSVSAFAAVNFHSIFGTPMALRYIMFPLLDQLSRMNSSETIIVSTMNQMAKQIGESLIVNQYVPQLLELMKKHSSKVSKGSIICETTKRINSSL